MKNLSWVLLLSLPLITWSANVQAANGDFCEKYPLNARCKQNNSENSTNSSDNKIVNILTLETVEQYLKELGYIEINKINETSLSLLMQGRPCTIILAKNGQGMSIGSYYPKEEKTTLEVLNDWNKSLRYSFAFIYKTKQNSEGVILETNITITGGVTEQRIKTFFRHHVSYQTYFNQYLNKI